MLESRPVTLMMSPLKPPFRGISSRPRLRTRLRVLVPKNEQFCPDLNEHPVLSHIELQSSWWRKSLSAILWPVEAFSWLTFTRSKLATWLKSPSCWYTFIHMHIYIYIYCIIHIDSTVAAVHSGPGTGSLATGLDVKHRPTGACNPTYYCWKPAWNAYPNVLLAILDEIQKYWARKWNIRYTFGGIVISTSCWPMVG